MYSPLLEALEQGHTVVTGNNRLARTLRHAYDQHRLAAGDHAWQSPAILSWAAWQQTLWEASRLAGGRAAEHLALSSEAADFLWLRALQAAEADAAELPLTQLARQARSTWATLHDWQGQAADEWTGAGLSPDQQAFVRWSGEFRRLCAEQGAVDPERRLELLLNDVQQGLFDGLPELHMAGCDDLPPMRLAFLDALRTRGVSAVIHDGGGQAETQGVISGGPWPDAAEELLAAAGWARQQLDARPDAAIAVVVPDLAQRAAEVRRTFLDVFAPAWRTRGIPQQLPLNISYGYPLAETPLVHTALLVLGMLDGDCSFDALSLLLRSRWLRGGRDEAGARAAAELRCREDLGPEFSLRDARYVCERTAPAFAGTLEVLIEAAGDRRQRSATEWADWFVAVLKATGWPAREQLDSESWQTLKAWNEALGMYAGGAARLGSLARSEARGLLAQLLQQRLFQPEGPAQGVQVLGALEAAGHRFDKLWVTGMARELWPPAGKPDPFIPLPLQRRLGMPDSSSAVTLQYHAGVTQRLLKSAAEVVVSWPGQQDGEGLAASPLLGAFSARETDHHAVQVWNSESLGAAELETLEPDPPPPWQGAEPVRGGVSVLNRQAVSPLNAFIERRLGAAEIRLPVVGIDAMQRGNLIHRALELFYAEYPSSAAAAELTPEVRRAALRSGLEDAAGQLPGMHGRFMQALAEREIDLQLGRIEAFLEVDLARPSFEVVELETLHEVKLGPLALRLKLDRLDELADGARIVIDYKTGQVNRQNWNPAAPRDVQLPVYVSAVVPDAAAIAFAQIATRGIGYDGVGGEDLGIEGLRSPGNKQRVQVRYQASQSGELLESWEALRREWALVIEQLAAGFAQGDFRLDPRNPDSARGQFAVLSRLYDQGIGVWEDEA